MTPVTIDIDYNNKEDVSEFEKFLPVFGVILAAGLDSLNIKEESHGEVFKYKYQVVGEVDGSITFRVIK